LDLSILSFLLIFTLLVTQGARIFGQVGIACPSDLKRNENIFVIGAQVDRGAFADLGLGASHRFTILS
jgi:hypothetical protein